MDCRTYVKYKATEKELKATQEENKTLKENIDIILKGMDCLREELIKAKDEVKGLTDIIEEQVVTIKGLNETIAWRKSRPVMMTVAKEFIKKADDLALNELDKRLSGYVIKDTFF